jgi:predicted ArsR family transcriptional regulator
VGKDDLATSLATAALLVDAVRGRIYRFVRRARRPVTRDEAAAAARVSRNLAAFHLDRLVDAGLLRASSGHAAAPRVGRRPKVYELGPAEVHLDVPRRQHGLLAGVLVETLTAGGSDAARRTAVEAARRRGGALGRAARAATAGARDGPADARAALEDLGCEPYDAGPGVLRLGNCPFHPLAAQSRDLVCALNEGLVAGLLAGLEAEGVEAVLAPRAGECCVEVRTAGGGSPGDARLLGRRHQPEGGVHEAVVQDLERTGGEEGEAGRAGADRHPR